MAIKNSLLGAVCLFIVIVGIRQLLCPDPTTTTVKQAAQPAPLDYKISYERLKKYDNLVPVAVIGSGPAGLSAALYTSRMNLYTVVFKGSLAGGQLMKTSDIENWPGIGRERGAHIMESFQKQIERFGAQLTSESIERVDFNQWPYKLWTDEGKEINALAVIIATGAYPRQLQIPGEQRYWGQGVSTCAVCDAPFYKGRTVVVIGGGDSAAEQALELSRFAKQVIVLIRGASARASAIMQQRLFENARIEVRFNTKVTAIQGNDTRVTGVVLNDPQKGTHKLDVDGVFIAIGHDPNSKIFKDFITCDKLGYIELTSRGQATSKPGIFASGDVADFRYRQAGVAAGDGIKAALDLNSFLEDKGWHETIDTALEPHYYSPTSPVAMQDNSNLLSTVATSQELDAFITQEQRPLVLYFSGPSSTPEVHAMITSLAQSLSDKLKFLKNDVTQSPMLSQRFHVPSVPSLVVIKQGNAVGIPMKAMNKRQMWNYLQRFIGE
jgi:thioredoxin reductase (NADPH)